MCRFFMVESLLELDGVDRMRESFIDQINSNSFFTVISQVNRKSEIVSSDVHFHFNDLSEDNVDTAITFFEFCLMIDMSYESQPIEGSYGSHSINGTKLSIQLDWRFK